MAYSMHQELLRSMWRTVRPDVCHVQWIDDRLWHCARAGLRPLVATAWGSDLNGAVNMPRAAQRKIAEGLAEVDLLITDSEDMIETAQCLTGRKLNSLLLPIGIDVKLFGEVSQQSRTARRQQMGISPDAIVLLSARQLGANYRHANILSAFASARRFHDREMHLIVRTFGHGGKAELATLQAHAVALGVADCVHWIGDIPYRKLPALYGASDLVVNFPVMDSFPVTFLESFACGVPIVTNSLPAYRSSRLAPHLMCTTDQTLSALTSAICSSLSRMESLMAAAQAGREVVLAHYDEKITAKVLKNAYQSVISNSSLDSVVACRE
jgi:glycosyltransferase involved in cell wall biosynthesis